MLWVDDLARMDADYLRERLRPFDYDLDPRCFGLALAGTAPAARERVLASIHEDVRTRVMPWARAVHGADPREIRLCQLRVLAVYLWEMVYNLRPDVYAAFSECETFRFDLLVPPDELAGAAVIDLGCGSGKALPYLADHARLVRGIEPARGLRERAAARVASYDHVTVSDGTFAAPGATTGAWDVVTSFMAFQHTNERGGDRGLVAMANRLLTGAQSDALGAGRFQALIAKSA